jgi:aryl-alcohol dehydrogenase-like predicted oxidoreductase
MQPVSRRTFVNRAAAAAGGGVLSSLAEPLIAALAAATPARLARRRFGRFDAEVTLVGLGGGSRFYEPVPDDEVGAELVRRAIDLGVGVVETASDYGHRGESEVRIGMAMRTHRSKVFLETKIEPRDYDGAMRDFERSLRRLQTDRVDLLLHHYVKDAGDLARIAGPAGAERAVRALVDQKVVRFRGFSCHDPALTISGVRALEPDAVQVPITAVRVPDFEREVLPATADRGIAVVAMKTCGHGYFRREHTTRPDRLDQFGPPPAAWDRPDLPTYREYLHYALSLPVATAVVGIDSVPTLLAVVENARDLAPLGRAEREAISRRAQVFATTGYWVPEPRAGA